MGLKDVKPLKASTGCCATEFISEGANQRYPIHSDTKQNIGTNRIKTSIDIDIHKTILEAKYMHIISQMHDYKLNWQPSDVSSHFDD